MITIIPISIILTILIIMSIIGYTTFKGIRDALEGNRQQLEQLLLAHEQQSTILAKLVIDFGNAQRELNKTIEELRVAPSLMSANDSVISVNPTATVPIEPKPSSKSQVKKDEAPIEKETKHSLFFAKAYEYPDRMVIEAKAYDDAETTVPFKVEAKGSKGVISFNTACYEQVASNVKVLVLPFCDVNMATAGNPQGIVNMANGEVALRNGEWVIIKKPSIKII